MEYDCTIKKRNYEVPHSIYGNTLLASLSLLSRYSEDK